MLRPTRFVLRALIGIGATATAYQLTTTSRIRADFPAAEEEDSRKVNAFETWKSESTREYENRLRAFSHPYKVFQYFASVVRPSAVWESALTAVPLQFNRENTARNS
jgi:hypothetical protein